MARRIKISDQIYKVIEDVDAICLQYGVKKPHEYMAEIMAGRDPRYDTSLLFDLVASIKRENRMPTKDEWEELTDLVLSDPAYQYAKVTLSMATDAAKTLLPYTVPKMKAVEIEGEVETKLQAPEMTAAEIRKLKMELEDDDSF